MSGDSITPTDDILSSCRSNCEEEKNPKNYQTFASLTTPRRFSVSASDALINDISCLRAGWGPVPESQHSVGSRSLIQGKATQPRRLKIARTPDCRELRGAEGWALHAECSGLLQSQPLPGVKPLEGTAGAGTWCCSFVGLLQQHKG